MSSLRRLGRKWENNIKVNITEIVYVGTVLCGSSGQFQSPAVMNLHIDRRWGIYGRAEQLPASQNDYAARSESLGEPRLSQYTLT
jgi:hypothetical protein